MCPPGGNIVWFPLILGEFEMPTTGGHTGPLVVGTVNSPNRNAKCIISLPDRLMGLIGQRGQIFDLEILLLLQTVLAVTAQAVPPNT